MSEFEKEDLVKTIKALREALDNFPEGTEYHKYYTQLLAVYDGLRLLLKDGIF